MACTDDKNDNGVNGPQRPFFLCRQANPRIRPLIRDGMLLPHIPIGEYVSLFRQYLRPHAGVAAASGARVLRMGVDVDCDNYRVRHRQRGCFRDQLIFMEAGLDHPGHRLHDLLLYGADGEADRTNPHPDGGFANSEELRRIWYGVEEYTGAAAGDDGG